MWYTARQPSPDAVSINQPVDLSVAYQDTTVLCFTYPCILYSSQKVQENIRTLSSSSLCWGRRLLPSHAAISLPRSVCRSGLCTPGNIMVTFFELKKANNGGIAHALYQGIKGSGCHFTKVLRAPFSVQSIPAEEPIYRLKALVKWYPGAQILTLVTC